jgi:hypothetical protein
MTGENQIVLTESVRQFRGETSDVVIFAGGGESSDAILRQWLTAEYGSDKPLLIVDFLDEHHTDAKKLSKKRQWEYHNRDIYPVDISVAQGRLEMFLRRQRIRGIR